MRAATVVQQLCKSRRTCFKFYCMFYFTCDRSFKNSLNALQPRAGFKGGPGDPGPRPPTNKGPPPNPSYFIFGSIDTHNSCVYTTYASMTPRINFFPYLNTGCIYTTTVQCESKNPPPLKFFDIFSQTVGNFSPNFTCLLYIHIYAGLQSFIQLSATLMRF